MKKYFIVFSLIILSHSISWAQDYQSAIFKLTRVFSLINFYYVDSVNNDKLIDAAIVATLKKLDPHSIYIPKDEVKAMNEPLEGNFEGVGIQFAIVDDTLQVVIPIANGPSEKVGIRAGDRIVKVNDKNIAGIGLKNSDVVHLLRGKKGTKVNVVIKRLNEKKLLDFTIIRDKIPIYSLDAYYMLNKNTIYFKLSRFASKSDDELISAFDSLNKTNKIENIVFDLRGNGGGYLRTAFKIADEFLTKGRMIVYTKGIHSPYSDYKATDRGFFEKGRLVVLIDENTASASEIVSGAIQDWDRGVIIGRRSFGKGLVQQPFTLQDTSMIRLTIAKYYTPSGRLIQKPYNKGEKKYEMDIINRYNHGELTNADSIHFPDSLRYTTNIYHRTVYGGGGIMPDIFIPLDTTKKYSVIMSKIFRKGLLNSYIVNYIDKNRKMLHKQYPSFKSFNKNFSIDNDFMSNLLAEAEKNGIKLNEDDNDKQKFFDDSLSRTLLKALIARDLWSTTEYFKILNQNDEVIQKAIDIIGNKKRYEQILKGKK